MIVQTYDRYSLFRSNGSIAIVPFGEVPVKNSDRYEQYVAGVSRLDSLSYKYYNNSNYGWLILQANPQYGSMEFNIPDGSILRIPYPLEESINDYNNSIDEYNKLYK